MRILKPGLRGIGMSKAAEMAKWGGEFEPDAKVDCEQLLKETGRNR
jgi:hypothetical protein